MASAPSNLLRSCRRSPPGRRLPFLHVLPTLVTFPFGLLFLSRHPGGVDQRLTADSHPRGDQGGGGYWNARLLRSPVHSHSSPRPLIAGLASGAWPRGERSFLCPSAPLEVKDLKVRERPWAFPEPTAHGALLSPHQAQAVTTQKGPGPTSQLRNQAQSIGGAACCTQTQAQKGTLLLGDWDSYPTGSLSEARTFLGSAPPPRPASTGDGDVFQGCSQQKPLPQGHAHSSITVRASRNLPLSSMLRPLLTQGAHPQQGA